MNQPERDALLVLVKMALRDAQAKAGRPLSLFEMHQAVDSVKADSSPAQQAPGKT